MWTSLSLARLYANLDGMNDDSFATASQDTQLKELHKPAPQEAALTSSYERLSFFFHQNSAL